MKKNSEKYREMQRNGGREMGAEPHSQNIGFIIAHANLNPVTPSHRKMQHTFTCTHIPAVSDRYPIPDPTR